MATRSARPERRYEVFISSTFTDLENIREAIAEATMRSGHIPIGMEFFHTGPRDIDHISTCIAESDIFAILVGARYGSIVKKMGGHFIDFEYKEATRLKKPILAYVLNDAEYQAARSTLIENDPERRNDSSLRRFREAVKKDSEGYGRIIDYFSLKPEHRGDLKGSYERALRQLAGGLNEGGWVRGELYDELRGRTGLSEIVSRNPFFRDFIKRLDKFDILSQRVAASEQHFKPRIARHFLDQNLGWLIQSGVRKFFFESGSSIAFLSQEFIASLHGEEWMNKISHELQVHTNNIITYLDFGLSERIHIELYPFGPPEQKYGATFGPLTMLTKLSPGKVQESFEPAHAKMTSEVAPNNKERWQEEVEKLAHWFRTHYGRNGIVFMTASGLEIEPTSRYHGPHVGSYYNMLFKRSILRSGCPVVMFLDEEKVLSMPFKTEDCYPVCDSTIPWRKVCRQSPFAVCLACASNHVTRVLDLLSELGLAEVQRKSVTDGVLVVCSNEAFKNRWT